MKSSKLLADTQVDIKIERGLKILQFASQHNIRKAFYRNCPLNSAYDHEEKTSSKRKSLLTKQNTENAEILMELNDQIANWERGSQMREKSIKNQVDASRNDKSRGTPQRSRNQSHISNHSATSKSKSKEDEDDNSHESLDDLSNYESEATRKKLKSIAQDPDEANSMNNQSKVGKANPSVIKSDLIRYSDLNSVDEYNDSSMRSQKSTKQKVQQVKKPNKQQNKDASKFAKKPTNSHHYSSSAIDHSHQYLESNDHKSKIQKKDSHISSKSSSSHHNSFLDKSISKIVSHSSQLRSKQESNRSNITEFQLMRELSSSFDDGQNMKLLLKLENCELEQTYLERRIVNRLEKGYKEANKILDITWESLRLPRMEYGFVRPNYAHIIQ